jgi:hypothetical protein
MLIYYQIEGAFIYAPGQVDKDDTASEHSGKREHVFFSSLNVLRVSPSPDLGPSGSPFRYPFTRHRPASISGLDLNVASTERSFPFIFELPGEDMPPSLTELGPESSSELFDITYKVKVVWAAHNDFKPRT